MKDTNSPNESFYSILGLKKTCSSSEVRCAYKRLAKKWHPDKFNSKAAALKGSATSSEVAKTRFQAIQEAYSVLSDNNKRLMYDAGVYDADDDELDMSSFMGEMADMMAKQQGEASESFEDLKAMFFDIMGDDFSKADIMKKEVDASSNDSSSNCCTVSCAASGNVINAMPMDTFSFETKSIESGKERVEGDGVESVDSLHELKQMFMNVVDPGFYTSTSRGTKSVQGIKIGSSQPVNEPITFEALVAETLFRDGLVAGTSLERRTFNCKKTTRPYEKVSGISRSVEDDRCSKRQKLYKEELDKFDELVDYFSTTETEQELHNIFSKLDD